MSEGESAVWWPYNSNRQTQKDKFEYFRDFGVFVKLRHPAAEELRGEGRCWFDFYVWYHFNVDFSTQHTPFPVNLRQFIMKDLPWIRKTHSCHLSHWNPIACNLIAPGWSSLVISLIPHEVETLSKTLLWRYFFVSKHTVLWPLIMVQLDRAPLVSLVSIPN